MPIFIFIYAVFSVFQIIPDIYRFMTNFNFSTVSIYVHKPLKRGIFRTIQK